MISFFSKTEISPLFLQLVLAFVIKSDPLLLSPSPLSLKAQLHITHSPYPHQAGEFLWEWVITW